MWCQWVPSDDGTKIAWNGEEKFYDYAEWLQYIVAHFLKPWGRTLNGSVTWAGEDHEDRGMIQVIDNDVRALQGRTVYS